MEWKLWAEQQVREQTVKANFRAGIRFAHVREMLELQRCFYNKQSRDKRRAKPLQLFLRNNKLWEFSFATIPPIKEIPACLPFLMTQQECELTPDCVYRSFISIRCSCMHRGETQETFWLFPWRTFTRTATPVTICFHRDCFSGLVLKEEKILNIWNFMQIKWMKISGTLWLLQLKVLFILFTSEILLEGRTL